MERKDRENIAMAIANELLDNEILDENNFSHDTGAAAMRVRYHPCAPERLCNCVRGCIVNIVRGEQYRGVVSLFNYLKEWRQYMLDDLIMQIIECMKADARQLKKEYEDSQTKDLANLPAYGTVKAYCDAVKALNRIEGGYKAYTTPRAVLKQMGVENV